MGYNPWHCRELDMTEHTHVHTREMSSLAGEGTMVGERSSPGVWSLPGGPQMDDKLGSSSDARRLGLSESGEG